MAGLKEADKAGAAGADQEAMVTRGGGTGAERSHTWQPHPRGRLLDLENVETSGFSEYTRRRRLWVMAKSHQCLEGKQPGAGSAGLAVRLPESQPRRHCCDSVHSRYV